MVLEQGGVDPARARPRGARPDPDRARRTLANKVGNGLPAVYVVCTDPIYEPGQASRDWIRRAGWRTVEIATGHDAMVIAPDRLADLLDAESA
jgi:hypothetical protein